MEIHLHVLKVINSIGTGVEEGDVDKLRSILAQLEFQHLVESWEREGVPFTSHLHVSGIRELTRECLVAITADIETRNYRQEFNSSRGIPPENPRSSTTDDIECFFSVLRDMVGKDFTLNRLYAKLNDVIRIAHAELIM